MDKTKRQITKIAREVNKLVIRNMKKHGMGSGEMDMIHLIRHNPGVSQKEIHEQLSMDKGAVARRIRNLEQKGYLIREKNPADGRSQLIYATAKASVLKISKVEIEEAFYRWLLEEFDEEEQEQFVTLLERLYHRSKKESRSGFPNLRISNEDNNAVKEKERFDDENEGRTITG